MGEPDADRSFNCSMNAAVFLDRDGVINRALVRAGRAYAPTSLEQLEFLPNVGEAIEKLRRAGFRLIVVTNQPDVAAGAVQREVVEAMHQRIRDEFLIDDIRVCYHGDQHNCLCRKPKPGMLIQAAKEWRVDLQESFMIGDTWRDMAAGKAAGCRTILVNYEYSQAQPQESDAAVRSLLEASELILSGSI